MRCMRASGIHACDEVLVHEAVPTVQLQTLVNDLPLLLGRPELGHRSRGCIERTGNQCFDALVDEAARDLRDRRQLGQPIFRVLKLGDRLSERLAFPNKRKRRLESALHCRHGHHPDDGALIRQV